MQPGTRQKIVNALVNAFDLDGMSSLLADVNKEFRLFDFGGATIENRADRVVAAAWMEGWLLELLDAACARRDRSVTLPFWRDEIVKVIGGRMPRDFDLTRLCRLRGDAPFINRINFRSAVGSLRARHGKSILVVRDAGAPLGNRKTYSRKSGKSASWKLITELAHRTGEFYPVMIDLNDTQERLGVNQPVDPSCLAERLVDKLNYDLPLPPAPADMQWPRWNMRFIDRLEALIRKDARAIWLVIDEFNSVDLPDASIDLVKQIVIKLLKGEMPNVRLVLLGFADVLPSGAGPLSLIDEVQPNLSGNDLFDFFRVGWEQHGLTIDKAMLEKFELTVVEIMSNLQCAQDEFLETVGTRASAALSGLLSHVSDSSPAGVP